MLITFKDPGLFVGNLKAALLAASEDYTRPISCVRLEVSAGVARFVATDGHWMWINEIPCSVESADGAGAVLYLEVEVEDVKSIAKMVDDSKKGSAWPVDLDTEARTVKQLSSTFTFMACERVYPPYAQIVPATVGGERIIACFDARLMSRVVAAFAAASGKEVKKGKVSAVPLQFHTTAAKKLKHDTTYPEPIVITGANAAVASALAIVMPMNTPTGGPGALLAKYRGVAEKASAA